MAVGDRMFLGMQDFDFCPNFTKFTQILPNLSKFNQIFPKFNQNSHNSFSNLSKKFVGGCGRIPYIPSYLYATGITQRLRDEVINGTVAEHLGGARLL